MSNNWLEQIQKTDARVIAFGAIAFLALLGPVIVEIHIVAPELFLALTLSKLVLLALGATLPVAVLNTLLCIAATINDKASPILPGTPDLNTSAGFLITALILYLDVGIQFFFDYSLRVFVIVGMLLEFLVLIWSAAQIANAKKTVK